MALSKEERTLAREAPNVGILLDEVGRSLFQAERYEDLDEALKLFFAENDAGTVAESRAHFYNQRLASLFTNWLITKHLEAGTELNWEKEFVSLIANVNSNLQQEASGADYGFGEYIKRESSKGHSITELATEVVSTCLEFASAK